MTIILGIDPGSRITGYGLIAQEGRGWRYLDSGCIRMNTEQPLPERVKTIFRCLGELIVTWRPTQASVEQVFLSNNADSALKLGQARGAVMATLASASLKVHEYATRKVKQSIVGTGAADKTQVAFMVRRLLPKAGDVSSDAADALAVAICAAHHRPVAGQRRLA